jgi:hypothetical protein
VMEKSTSFNTFFRIANFYGFETAKSAKNSKIFAVYRAVVLICILIFLKRVVFLTINAFGSDNFMKFLNALAFHLVSFSYFLTRPLWAKCMSKAFEPFNQIDLLIFEAFNDTVSDKKLKVLAWKVLSWPILLILFSTLENLYFLDSIWAFVVNILPHLYYFFFYFQLSFLVFLLLNLLFRLNFVLLKVREDSKVDVEIVHALMQLSFEALEEINRGFAINLLLTLSE